MLAVKSDNGRAGYGRVVVRLASGWLLLCGCTLSSLATAQPPQPSGRASAGPLGYSGRMPTASPHGAATHDNGCVSLQAAQLWMAMHGAEAPKVTAEPWQPPIDPQPHAARDGQPAMLSPEWIQGHLAAARQDRSEPVDAALLLGEDLLGESLLGGNPLQGIGPQAGRRPLGGGGTDGESGDARAGWDPHAEAFADTMYPSAIRCAACHQHIYDQWRVSAHAYASISPMFMKFEQAIQSLTRGTVGYFCLRCHAPVATQIEWPREVSLLEGPHVLREGVTCISCHRVVERYGRVNGERRIEPGNLYDPVVGNSGGQGVATVVADPKKYRVKLSADDPSTGESMHTGAIQFEQLADSSYCAGCHQVVVEPGIPLEIVWAQYRSSPARARGVSCQDCHMGQVPGKDSGYAMAACAKLEGRPPLPPKKHANHLFYGPSMPLAHPGLFPHNEKSLRWKPSDWLLFDWRADWGTEAFELQVKRNPAAYVFPEAWRNAQERRDARKVVDENQRLVEVKRRSAIQTMEGASRIDGPWLQTQPRRGQPLQLTYRVTNTSDGHNLPTGSLGAQPQLWLNVALVGPDGRRLWESGYLDGNGDLCDHNSLQVQNGLAPRDAQLFNLQTRFLITNVKGTDREVILPVNVDIDPLPFFRPANVPVSVLNHAPFARMEARSLPPLGSRDAKYRIPAEVLRAPGRYRLTARLRSRVEPVYFMRFVQGTADMERSLAESILDLHTYSVEFVIP